MCSKQIATIAILLLSMPSSDAATGVRGLRPKSTKIIRSGRIVGLVPLETRMSVGLNQQSYIFEFDKPGPGDAMLLAKISYRFALREPEMPHSFLSYALLHTLAMRRDESCDEAWGTLSKTYRFDEEGKFHGSYDPIIYSEGAPRTKVGINVMLPCYVVTPQDYRTSTLLAGGDHIQTQQGPKDEAR